MPNEREAILRLRGMGHAAAVEEQSVTMNTIAATVKNLELA
jgi:hypothetical protein